MVMPGDWLSEGAIDLGFPCGWPLVRSHGRRPQAARSELPGGKGSADCDEKERLGTRAALSRTGHGRLGEWIDRGHGPWGDLGLERL